MEQNKVRNAIRKNYNLSDKGKAFIVHLIRNFIPSSERAIYVIEKPEKKLQCCITGKALQSKSEAIDPAREAADQRMQLILDGLKNGKDVPTEKEQIQIALSSKGSDRFLCLEAVKQLNIFVSEEILNGNKHIEWVMKDIKAQMKPKEDVAPVQKSKREELNPALSRTIEKKTPKPEDKKRIETANALAEQKKKLKPTLLGDLSALQKLKEQLEAEEKLSNPDSTTSDESETEKAPQ